MSSIQERLQLKRVPLDTWNIREQLCLASAVVRSGDQNWMSVSRSLKTVGEPNRPPDWYSQKSCAAQYGALLEHVETPKRKKRSSEGAVETPQESILKRLTQERIVEIQKELAEINQQYEQISNNVSEARNPNTSDDRIKEIWAAIETAKRNKERETARRAAWLKEREEKRARADRTWRPPVQAGAAAAVVPAPASPLLTSLLKSSPVVTTPQHISHPANVVDCVSPSAGAPTLSMLLEKAAAHDNKHAAIEHIKSQLVQIEHQLKANSQTPPPAPLPAAAPSLDIDDIEIKAEDVYAFRDIDIHIPPVTTIHKGARPVEKPELKKVDTEAPRESENNEALDSEQITQDDVKTEPMLEDVAEEIVPVQSERTTEPPPEVTLPQPEVVEPPSTTESIKIAFPEVKFPTPEIKVIQPEEKIKEEIKETETVPPQPEPVQVEPETNVEDTPPPPEQDASKQPEATVEPVEEPQNMQVPNVEVEDHRADEAVFAVPTPENIPLPPEPREDVAPVTTTEIPLPSDSEPIKEEPELPQTVPEQSTEESETVEVPSSAEKIVEEDVQKSEEPEESVPLKEVVSEDSQPEKPAPANEELPSELKEEEAHMETDDDTPMELVREEEKDGKTRRDYSRKKKPDSRTCSGSESAAETSAPDSPSAGAGDGERQHHKLWKKSVMLVYSRLCAHKYASIFLRPISDEEAPGYSVVIKRPMDLTTIRRNIEAGVVRTTAEFQRDVLLMLSNALMYNSSEHSVYVMAREMHEEAQCQLGMLLAAQAHAGLTPPARRKRRRPESPLIVNKIPRLH